MRRTFSTRLTAVLFVGVTAVGLLDAQPPQRNPEKDAKPEFKTMEGTVKDFTMGPDEIINGIALEDGTLAHWPVEITFRFTEIVDLGDKVKIAGWLRKTGDQSILEISSLTNLTNGKSAKNDQAPPPPPATDRKSVERRK